MNARDELREYADRYGYTEHVNKLLDGVIAEALREAAEALRVEHRRIFWATKPDTCPEAEFLDRMAAATTQPDPRPAVAEAGGSR
jgi:hypothetical protein